MLLQLFLHSPNMCDSWYFRTEKLTVQYATSEIILLIYNDCQDLLCFFQNLKHLSGEMYRELNQRENTVVSQVAFLLPPPSG